MPRSPSRRPEPPTWNLTVGLVVTNLIKIGGLVVVLVEVFTHDPPRSITLVVAAFMMAGAQGIETLLDRLLK